VLDVERDEPVVAHADATYWAQRRDVERGFSGLGG
jgi:hypothetical protein